jgi:predicted nucleic acid-binding protein
VTETTASESVIVDSSGWLEYITGDSKAHLFAPYLEADIVVLVPTIVIFEVRKILLGKVSRTLADFFYSTAQRKTIVGFDETLAIKSAENSVLYKLPMADAIIYATAEFHKAKLITSDSHFSDLPGVVLL